VVVQCCTCTARHAIPQIDHGNEWRQGLNAESAADRLLVSRWLTRRWLAPAGDWHSCIVSPVSGSLPSVSPALRKLTASYSSLQPAVPVTDNRLQPGAFTQTNYNSRTKAPTFAHVSYFTKKHCCWSIAQLCLYCAYNFRAAKYHNVGSRFKKLRSFF